MQDSKRTSIKKYLIVKKTMKRNYTLINDDEVKKLDLNNIYIALKIGNSASKNSDHLYFISEEYATKTKAPISQKKFVAVSFPESQLFLDDYTDSIYLISDDKGVKLYGNSSYFVEKDIYEEVKKAFEKEMNIGTYSGSIQEGRYR